MFKGTIGKWLTYSILIICLYLIAMLSVKNGIPTGLIFSFFPLILIVLLFIVNNPYWGLMAIFVLNYFIMGISRYLPTISSLGIATDVMILLAFVSFLVSSIFKEDIAWYRVKDNLLLKFLLLWLLYCIIEVLNPSSVTLAWLASIRLYAVYPICIVLFTTLLFYRFKDFKMILFLWSIFTLLAVLKVIMQIRWGWDSAEVLWLMSGDNARTHLLVTGIRYFSFFTDAGCFGSNMGYAMVVFGIAAFNIKSKGLRTYYLFVAAAATYAMFVSGTRGALAVPFAGFILYTILSKNTQRMFAVGLFVLVSLLFLNYTTIGDSNSYIRRMRTAFDSEDASLIARQENRKILAVYMKNKPFGEGLGLSGGEGYKYAPERLTTNIPNDSWFVKIWVESGPVGVALHVALLLFFVGYGVYVVMFRIKDKELRNLIAAILCGEVGIIVSSWGNPIFVQYPTGILNYMIQAFVFMALSYDKEIETTNIPEHEG